MPEEADATIFGNSQQILFRVYFFRYGLVFLEKTDKYVLNQVFRVVPIHNIVIDKIEYITIIAFENMFKLFPGHI